MSVRDKPCHSRKDRANGPGALCGSRRLGNDVTKPSNWGILLRQKWGVLLQR